MDYIKKLHETFDTIDTFDTFASLASHSLSAVYMRQVFESIKSIIKKIIVFATRDRVRS